MPPRASAYDRKANCPRPRITSRDLRCSTLNRNHVGHISRPLQHNLPFPPGFHSEFTGIAFPEPEDNELEEPKDITSHGLPEAFRLQAEEYIGIEPDLDKMAGPSTEYLGHNHPLQLHDRTNLSPKESDVTGIPDVDQTAQLEVDPPTLEIEWPSDVSSDTDDDMASCSDMTNCSTPASSCSVQSFETRKLNNYVITTSQGPPERGILCRRLNMDYLGPNFQLNWHRTWLIRRSGLPPDHFTLKPRPKTKVRMPTTPPRKRCASIQPSPLRVSITMEEWNLKSTGDMFLDREMWLENGQPEQYLVNWNIW